MLTKHVSVVIERPVSAVYAFVADVRNLPAWAGGLAGAEVTRAGSGWGTDSPMGRVTFTFAPANEYGVLDHNVTLPSGEVAYNPFRVIAHPHGTEAIFTLRQLGSVAEFERDAQMVQSDLARLKALLEGDAA